MVLGCRSAGFALLRSLATASSLSFASHNSHFLAKEVMTAGDVPVIASMKYVDASTQVAHVGRGTTGDDSGEIQEITWKEQTVSIHNVRDQNPTLHEQGAEVRTHSLQNTEQGGEPIDFLDREDVLKRYYPLCEDLVRQCLSESTKDNVPPTLVRAFDHNVRMATSVNYELKNSGDSKIQQPLQLVHGDYTSISAPRRLRDLAQPPKLNDVWREQSPEGLLDPALVGQSTSGKDRRRFALINVWRSIDRSKPVQAFPLACVDASTVATSQDLRTLQVHYADRIGENYLAAHNPQHKWMYWPAMTFDEAMLIKQWDSEGAFAMEEAAAAAPTGDNDPGPNSSDRHRGVSTFALHSAFDAASHEESPAPRERKSIEVRCVVIY